MLRLLLPLPFILSFALLLSACGSSGGAAGTAPTESDEAPANNQLAPHVYEPPRPVADFALTDQDGQPVHLSDSAGKARLVYVGYTNCPDICPTTMANWKSVRQELGADADNVEFVMITSDPDRDTPAVLKEYLANFDPSFVGMTGPVDDLMLVYADMGVMVELAAGPGQVKYDVNHTSSSYLIDGDGLLRMKIPYGLDATGVADAVRSLLRS